MRIHFRVVLGTMILGLMLAHHLFGWGQDGHQIVALVAVQHLTPAARVAVFNLLKKDPDTKALLKKKKSTDLVALGAAMAQASTWADRVKHTPLGQGTADWHFLDLASNDDATTIDQRCDAGNCVTVKIREFQANLPLKKSYKTSTAKYAPSAELKFLIHFVGDIHQPLHCATNADAGGNCLSTTGFGESELHAVWDTGLVVPLKGTGAAAKSDAGVAQDLDTEFASQFNTWSTLTAENDIALESKAVAFATIYAPLLSFLPPPEPRPFLQVTLPSCLEAPDIKAVSPIDLTQVFNQSTEDIVRQQLTKAGYRLAALLNGIWP